MNLSINLSYIYKTSTRSVNVHKGKQGKVVLLSATAPPSITCVHPLSASHSSHQIKFLLCSALVLYLQNVLLEQHKHVTMRTLSFTQSGSSFLVKKKSFAFLLFPLKAEFGLINAPSYLFCLFFTRLFLKNRPLRMCKLRSHFGGKRPDQGGLKLSELDE